MQFALGYRQQNEDDMFSPIALDNKDSLGEIYFSWPKTASEPPVQNDENTALQMEELRELRKSGLKLNFLLNANC